jgi:uncharacterized MAPEG superfamily protein
MTVPLWCLLIAVLMPYVLTGVGAYFRIQQLGEIDTHAPRVQAMELRGPAARAYGAQLNMWEAIAVFTAAVVTAHLAGADPVKSAMAAELFILARIFHAIFYVSDLDKLRTLSFTVGFGACIWLFVLAASA